MATVTTFGVVPSDIAERLQNFTASTTSGPTSTQIEGIIKGQAGLLCSLLYGMGVADPASVTTTHPAYQLCREYVILMSAARSMQSRERSNPELANSWVEDADRWLDRIKEMPALLTDLRPTGPNAPNLNWSPTNDLANQERLALSSQSQAVRNGAVYRV